MSTLDWTLSFALFIIYVACLVTVCGLTFRKGYTVLGIVGIFFPILWLIGAILPTKEGSQRWVQEREEQRRTMEQMTN